MAATSASTSTSPQGRKIASTSTNDSNAKMSVPRERLLALMKAQCQIFGTTYNPDRIRMGNKVLRQRLKGAALAAYYPRKTASVIDVQRAFGPELITWDEKDVDRMEHLDELKKRNKSAPKKKKEGPKKKKQ